MKATTTTIKGPEKTRRKTGAFAGWPKPGLQFLKGLRKDNSKAFFEANRRTYEVDLKAPTEALFAELERDFPTWRPKIFRINRDLRFSKDKRPYNDHVSGVFMSDRAAGGFYLQFSPDGLYLATGCYEMAPDQLKRYRDAVVGKEGEKLARVVAGLEKAGYGIGEPRLKRAPPGYDADHPRKGFLRRTGLMANRNEKPGAWLHTAEVVDRIRDMWRDTRPLNAWLEANVGGTTTPTHGR